MTDLIYNTRMTLNKNMTHPWLQRLPEARKQRVHGLIAAVQMHPLGHRQAHDDAERAPSHAAVAPSALPAYTLPLLLRGQRPVLVHKAGVLEGARLTSDLRPATYAGGGSGAGRGQRPVLEHKAVCFQSNAASGALLPCSCAAG